MESLPEDPSRGPDGPGTPLTDDEAATLAGQLREARRSGRTLTAISQTRRLRLDDAYRIQSALTEARIADGERRIGWKLGYTSRAMRDQMGVGAPNFGPLTDAMLLPDGGHVPGGALQPRVEPEIAVVLGDAAPGLPGLPDLPGHGGDAAQRLARAASAVASVHAALEVVDSVWTDYRFRLEDNTADGSSAAWFVLGPPLPAVRLDEVQVELTGPTSPPLHGSGADADGHPLRGVLWLAERLRERGDHLRPGDVVITGGLTRALPLEGPVRARFTPVAGASVEVTVLPTG